MNTSDNTTKIVVKDDNGFTYVSRELVYPMVSNDYKKERK
jgi:hypothetical protein